MSDELDTLEARLRHSVERLEPKRDRNAVQRMLRDRARRLAERNVEQTVREVVGEIVVVRRAQSSWGFPLDAVSEVRVVSVTRLPRATEHVCGFFQIRGQVHCLVDLQPFVGEATAPSHGDRAVVAVVERPPRVLGVRVDAVIGARTVFRDEIDATRRERMLELVADVTQDCVQIVDVDALFASEALRME